MIPPSGNKKINAVHPSFGSISRLLLRTSMMTITLSIKSKNAKRPPPKLKISSSIVFLFLNNEIFVQHLLHIRISLYTILLSISNESRNIQSDINLVKLVRDFVALIGSH